MKFYIKITLSLLIISSVANAQLKPLTDDQYFKNNFKDFITPLPTITKWVDNTHFLMIKSGEIFIVDAKTGQETPYTAPVSNTETKSIKPEIITKASDLYVRENKVDIRLTNDTMVETNPTLSPDGKYVAYTKLNNLYSVNIATQKETKLTSDGSEVILNGYASWVYTEEILGRASRYKSFWWSPDSKHIAFFRTDDSPVIPFILTDAPNVHGYVEKVRYPKVGDRNPEVKIGILAPNGGQVTWANFDAAYDQYFGQPVWRLDGSSLWVQWMNRKQDSLIIYDIDLASGNKKIIYTEAQKTWIQLEDGYDRLHMLYNNKQFILESDKTGWNNLYLHDITGKLINAVTPGSFTVTAIDFIDEAKKILYFTARGIENTARKDLYSVTFSGKNLKRLTFGEYNHAQINLSPDASYFVTNYNNSNSPSQLAIVDNKGKIIKQLANSKAPNYNQYAIANTEIIRVKSTDGLYELPLKITWPIPYDPTKKYPVLISIYGGPNAGTVMDNYSLNSNQQFYAKEGLIQVAMDHRGSGHFGKAGVNYMYHNLGYWEMQDYTTMVKWLINNASADSTKIAITGFSYGGYLTCYALTYGANVFTHGMAGGSVTDWTLYDTHYTERYMGTPNDNPLGYKTSSVLTYADKYKGMLQIAHGIIDDNVHLQNSIQLAAKLQDLKKDFEMMTYSGGRHGWGGNKGLHFQNLKTNFIYKYLLEKKVPKELIK